MFSPSFGAAVEPSAIIVPDNHSRKLLTHSDASAQRTAKLQQAGKPWLCVKHKITVTNEKCKAMKIASDTRQCSDCGLPLSLGIVTREELKMATKRGTCGYCEREDMAIVARGLCANCYGKYNRGTLKPKPAKAVEVAPEPEAAWTPPVLVACDSEAARLQVCERVAHVPSELTWDDFEDVPAPVLDRPCLVSIGHKLDRACFNSTLQRALGWKMGDRVEVRLSRKHNALVMRLAQPEAEKAFTVTSGGKSSVLAVACKTALKVLEAQAGKYHVSISDWGLTVWLDRPEEKAA